MEVCQILFSDDDDNDDNDDNDDDAGVSDHVQCGGRGAPGGALEDPPQPARHHRHPLARGEEGLEHHFIEKIVNKMFRHCILHYSMILRINTVEILIYCDAVFVLIKIYHSRHLDCRVSLLCHHN